MIVSDTVNWNKIIFMAYLSQKSQRLFCGFHSHHLIGPNFFHFHRIHSTNSNLSTEIRSKFGFWVLVGPPNLRMSEREKLHLLNFWIILLYKCSIQTFKCKAITKHRQYKWSSVKVIINTNNKFKLKQVRTQHFSTNERKLKFIISTFPREHGAFFISYFYFIYQSNILINEIIDMFLI